LSPWFWAILIVWLTASNVTVTSNSVDKYVSNSQRATILSVNCNSDKEVLSIEVLPHSNLSGYFKILKFFTQANFKLF
jgi:hypothetical protein